MPVVSPDGDESFAIENEAYTGEGTAINSDFLNGMNVDDAKEEIIKAIIELVIKYRPEAILYLIQLLQSIGT